MQELFREIAVRLPKQSKDWRPNLGAPDLSGLIWVAFEIRVPFRPPIWYGTLKKKRP